LLPAVKFRVGLEALNAGFVPLIVKELQQTPTGAKSAHIPIAIKLEQTTEQLKNSVEALGKTKEDFQRDVGTLAEETKNLKETRESMNLEVNKLNGEVNDLKKFNESYQAQVEGLKTTRSQLEEQTKQLTAQSHEMKETLEKYDKLSSALQGSVGKVEDTQHKLAELCTNYEVQCQRQKDLNSTEEQLNLRSLFRSLDKNSDKTLSAEEMKNYIPVLEDVYEKKFDIKKMDADGSGSISIKEFADFWTTKD